MALDIFPVSTTYVFPPALKSRSGETTSWKASPVPSDAQPLPRLRGDAEDGEGEIDRRESARRRDREPHRDPFRRLLLLDADEESFHRLRVVGVRKDANPHALGVPQDGDQLRGRAFPGSLSAAPGRRKGGYPRSAG